ncbi:MAG: adenosine kinase [Gammaproteobacteria bacterium]|nr:adenosine kinase [Gammaproteobacteria bacterium]
MNYHVYGIGNALVDMEFSVDDGYLQSHGIAKGHMTLVDEQRLIELTETLSELTPRRMSGGSAANTMYAMQGFGSTAYYACKVAGDEVGAYFLADLSRAGVTTEPHDEAVDGKSGRCLILITDDAERSMNTYLGISEQLSPGDVNAEAVANSEYVYIEGYLASSETGRAAAVHVREVAEAERTKTSLTLSDPSMVDIFRDGLQQMLGNGVHHLFCNEEEALTWARTDRLDLAANELKDIAPNVNITLGARGSLAIYPGASKIVPGYAVQPIDTNGAGDIYAGACLYVLTHDGSPGDAARFANYAASNLVARFGARFTSIEDYQGVRTRYPG